MSVMCAWSCDGCGHTVDGYTVEGISRWMRLDFNGAELPTHVQLDFCSWECLAVLVAQRIRATKD